MLPMNSCVYRISSPAALTRRSRPLGESSTKRGNGISTSAAFRCRGPVQEMPVFSNGVELDPTRKDAFGMPLLRVTGKRHDEDLRTARFIAGKAEVLLKAGRRHRNFFSNFRGAPPRSGSIKPDPAAWEAMQKRR